MITIFNGAELIITYDMKQQAEIRNILSANNIEYIVKVKNMQSSNWGRSGMRTRTGTLGTNANFSYEYKIYVKKKDLEQAQYLIR